MLILKKILFILFCLNIFVGCAKSNFKPNTDNNENILTDDNIGPVHAQEIEFDDSDDTIEIDSGSDSDTTNTDTDGGDDTTDTSDGPLTGNTSTSNVCLNASDVERFINSANTIAKREFTDCRNNFYYSGYNGNHGKTTGCKSSMPYNVADIDAYLAEYNYQITGLPPHSKIIGIHKKDGRFIGRMVLPIDGICRIAYYHGVEFSGSQSHINQQMAAFNSNQEAELLETIRLLVD